MIEMDIQKAYDKLDRAALRRILKELGFSSLFVERFIIEITVMNTLENLEILGTCWDSKV